MQKINLPFAAGSRLVVISVLPAIVCLMFVGITGADDKSKETGAASDSAIAGRFEMLDASTTGVDFSNQWPESIERSIHLTNSFISSGVAIGDIDNDGRPDIFVTRQSDGGRLYRNLGNFKFEDVTENVGIEPEGMWSTGATMVDINGDGWHDLYVCGYDCKNRLYINQQGRFVEQAAEYGLDFSGASINLTFADYDRDGDLDAYLLTNRLVPSSKPDLSRIRRNSAGEFVIPPDLQETVYVIDHPSGQKRIQGAGQFDRLYRNDDGRFVEVSEEAGIGRNPYFGLSASWWDYNQDGWPDLYVANDFIGPDQLFKNNGPNSTGIVTFTDVTPTLLPHTPWYSMGSDVGDVNNDGLLDYLASDMAGTNHYRDKLAMGNMSGPNSLAWFLNWPDPPQYMRNALYVNTGAGRFMEGAFLAGLAKTDWTWTVRFCDLDNDGWEDVYFTNGMSRDWFNGDLLNKARELRQQSVNAETDDTASGMGAGFEFLLNQPRFALENLAFRNNGDLTFDDVGAAWNLDHLGVSTGAATGDLDGDGDLDLVVNGFNEPLVIYRNDVARQSSIRFQLVGKAPNTGAIGAKVMLQRNGRDDVQTRYLSTNQGFMSSSENIVHFGVGEDERIARVTIEWPSGKVQTLDSLDAGQVHRIVEPTESTESRNVAIATPGTEPVFEELDNVFPGARHVERPYDDFAREPLLPNKNSRLGPGLAWGDVDGDSDDDMFMGQGAGQPRHLFVNQGGGRFEQVALKCCEEDLAAEDMGAVFFDVDGDADLDLYVVSGGVECEAGDEVLRDRLYLNDGNGNFEKADDDALPDARSSGSVAAAADFDRDGDVDLFVGGRIVPGQYPVAAESLLLINEQGRLTRAPRESAPGLTSAGMVTSAIWSDADGDGWLDLLVTCEWGPVRLFLNDKGKLAEATEAAGLGSRLGWYNSICGGDVDNDGDIDYVAGNFGLNTKYHPTAESPDLLFYGDFEGNGKRHIVEAKFENGTCLPIRGLGCSSDAMPFIREKLPTFHEFAISPLSEIYAPQSLDNALRLEVNDLHSVVLLNHSDGKGPRFEFVDLPSVAQISPIFGCQLLDFDGDRTLDLYVVQNFYGPQPETGYMDGGVSLLMKGNGDGTFTPIWPNASGIIVPGDAKSLVAADLDGDHHIELIIGKNDDAPQVFKRREPMQSTTIRLAGPAGNPQGLGSRVTVRFADGLSTVHEISAGGGYLSQAPAALVVSNVQPIEAIEVTWNDGSRSRHKMAKDAKGPVVISK